MAQVTMYSINLVGLRRNIPIIWVQNWRRYDVRTPSHQRILKKALASINTPRNFIFRSETRSLGRGAPGAAAGKSGRVAREQDYSGGSMLGGL